MNIIDAADADEIMLQAAEEICTLNLLFTLVSC